VVEVGLVGTANERESAGPLSVIVGLFERVAV
jgi:hypothetical protein